jgi:hypothetical protein
MSSLADKVYDEIEQTLLHHRLCYWQCEDDEGSYPLIDMLTPEGRTIQVGHDEIQHICDAIYNEVLTKMLGKPDMDIMRSEFEQWHVLHFIDPLTRSSGGSDYRSPNVVRRWEAWQGACEQRPGGDLELMKFYGVKTTSELIAAQEAHIAKLQAKVPPIPDQFPASPRHG